MGGVSFPLLSDWHPKGEMGKSYGVYSEEKGFTVRSTVIIDKQGIVRYSQAVEPGGRRHATELAEICRKVLGSIPGRWLNFPVGLGGFQSPGHHQLP